MTRSQYLSRKLPGRGFIVGAIQGDSGRLCPPPAPAGPPPAAAPGQYGGDRPPWAAPLHWLSTQLAPITLVMLLPLEHYPWPLRETLSCSPWPLTPMVNCSTAPLLTNVSPSLIAPRFRAPYGCGSACWCGVVYLI